MAKQTLFQEVSSSSISVLRLTEIFSKAKKAEDKKDLMLECLRNPRMPLDILKDTFNHCYDDDTKRTILCNSTTEAFCKEIIQHDGHISYSETLLIKDIFRLCHPLTILDTLDLIIGSVRFKTDSSKVAMCLAALCNNPRVLKRTGNPVEEEIISKAKLLIDTFRSQDAYEISVYTKDVFSNKTWNELETAYLPNVIFHMLKDKAIELLAVQYATITRL